MCIAEWSFRSTEEIVDELPSVTEREECGWKEDMVGSVDGLEGPRRAVENVDSCSLAEDCEL